MEERYESGLTRSAQVLDDVDRALERLSNGTYHSCEGCGATIADVDLSADPTRRVCELHLEGSQWSAAVTEAVQAGVVAEGDEWTPMAATALPPIRPAD